jgi:hypothetical protein
LGESSQPLRELGVDPLDAARAVEWDLDFLRVRCWNVERGGEDEECDRAAKRERCGTAAIFMEPPLEQGAVSDWDLVVDPFASAASGSGGVPGIARRAGAASARRARASGALRRAGATRPSVIRAAPTNVASEPSESASPASAASRPTAPQAAAGGGASFTSHGSK